MYIRSFLLILLIHPKIGKKLLKFCINQYHKHIVDREVNAILNENAIKSIMISVYLSLGICIEVTFRNCIGLRLLLTSQLSFY